MIDFLDGIALTSDRLYRETEFLIPDFLPKRMITMYYADGGNAKTWLSYGVAAYICQHNLAKRVYYIDLDNPLDTLKDRGVSELLMNRFANFKYIHRSDLEESPIELLEKLAHKDNSKHHAYEDMVLIIDSWRNVTNIKNDEKAMYMMNLLMDIREAGMTVVGIAHSNKDGKNYEGSNNIKNSLDVMFKQTLLKSVMGEYIVVNLDPKKERSGVRACDWKINTNTLEMTKADAVTSRMDSQETEFVNNVKALLAKHPKGLNKTDVLEGIGTRKDNKTAINLLKKFEGEFYKMEQDGKKHIYSLL
ncbi:hypothetical protein CP985_05695 [Malaciobacter mytili LMG 24559]|uniref:AAA family ATPase n=1 Tax=Malaciobacter mytili LMG 24559 TaxID=1032238 RepID=A0AAX2AGE2_9BACT|nr:AAA family ATPase [Malaciobacter mytili]AXH14357.1 hypothetical protein AMYT_0764 [Malaciobacter mytili LMG 24559]RXK16067.1 hypothetical protein CP985_05695 [Malaciobacter mytili LMG 24559]